MALGAHYQTAISPDSNPEVNALLRRLVRQCTGAARLVEKVNEAKQPPEEAVKHNSVLNDLRRQLKAAQEQRLRSQATAIQRSITRMEASEWEAQLLKAQTPPPPTKWVDDPTWLAHEIYRIKSKIYRWHQLLGHTESARKW